MNLLFAILILIQTTEVSIWARPGDECFNVFVEGKKVTLLSTSTPSNKRFIVKRGKPVEIMMASPSDTCTMLVLPDAERLVMTTCFWKNR